MNVAVAIDDVRHEALSPAPAKPVLRQSGSSLPTASGSSS